MTRIRGDVIADANVAEVDFGADGVLKFGSREDKAGAGTKRHIRGEIFVGVHAGKVNGCFLNGSEIEFRSGRFGQICIKRGRGGPWIRIAAGPGAAALVWQIRQ